MMSDYPLVVALGGYLIAINFVTFYAFWWDKQAAIDSAWRVPEDKLILLALIGGIVGAKLGQRVWRHKTRKEPFRTVLNLVIVLQMILLSMIAFPDTWNVVFDWVAKTVN